MGLFDQSFSGRSALSQGLSTVATTQIARMTRKNPSSTTAQIANQLLYTQQGQALIASSANLIAGGISATVSSIGAGIQSLFSDTSSQGASNTRITPSDAVASNFSGGTPQSGIFTTSVVSSGLTTPSVGSTQSATGLLSTDIAAFGAVSSRLGTDVPVTDAQYASLQEASNSSYKNTGITGLFTTGDLSINPTSSSTASGSTDNSYQISAWTQEISRIAGGNTDFANSAQQWYTSGLPDTASSTGAAVPGYSTSMRSDLVDIVNRGSGLYTGNSTLIPSTVTNYAAEQNGFQAVLGVAIEGGAAAAVQGLLSSDRANALSTKNLVSGALTNLSASPVMANYLVDYVGPANVRDVQTVMYNASRGSSLDSTTIASIGTLATKLSYDETTTFKSTNTTYGDEIIWNKSVVADTDRNYTTSVLTTDVVRIANGVDYTYTDNTDYSVYGGF